MHRMTPVCVENSSRCAWRILGLWRWTERREPKLWDHRTPPGADKRFETETGPAHQGHVHAAHPGSLGAHGAPRLGQSRPHPGPHHPRPSVTRRQRVAQRRGDADERGKEDGQYGHFYLVRVRVPPLILLITIKNKRREKGRPEPPARKNASTRGAGALHCVVLAVLRAQRFLKQTKSSALCCRVLLGARHRSTLFLEGVISISSARRRVVV